MNWVFTQRSLQAFLQFSGADAGLSGTAIPPDGSWGIASADVEHSGAVGKTRYVLHRDDESTDPRIVLLADAAGAPMDPLPVNARRDALQRVHRASLASLHPPMRLPADWAEYHTGNLVAFFACHRTHGQFRWIVEVGVMGSRDACFYRLTYHGNEVTLAEYTPPRKLYSAVVGAWAEAFRGLNQRLRATVANLGAESLQASIDLEVATFGAVTQHRTYSMWFEHLTEKQRAFIELPVAESVKLRGAAGTGKTLTLELKALREVYGAEDSGQEPKVLFVTHSWATAMQVDSSLRMLDERGSAGKIDVYPLLAVARTGLPGERAASAVRLLGEDSFSGKQLQLRRIDEVVEQLTAGEWLAFRGQTTEDFRARVDFGRGTPGRNALVWDLMLEFATVLSAHGILPGVNAESRYLSLQRTPWMMPLGNNADRRFVLRVYTEFVAGLRQAELLTSDQLINDYLNYLETFTWNLRRSKDGYDLIFVDETHLFNEQERLILHYLTRSAAEYPKMFMALDPRQSPSEVYVEFPASLVASAESGTAEHSLGKYKAVDLTTIHRFTPEILGLVAHIHRMYPALSYGADWQVDIESIDSSAKGGPLPGLVTSKDPAEELERISARAQALLAKAPREARVAVVVLDAMRLPDYEQKFAVMQIGTVVLQSRDDVESLRYSRRSIVLTAAEYVGGLQFDTVLVGGISNAKSGVANMGHQRRRFLSLLYLAISRAERFVELYTNDRDGGVPEILEQALAKKILLMKAEGAAV